MRNILIPNGRILDSLTPVQEGLSNSTLTTGSTILEGINKLIDQGKKPCLTVDIISENPEKIKRWIGCSDSDIEPGVNILNVSEDSILAIRYNIIKNDNVTSSKPGNAYTNIKFIDLDFIIQAYGEDGYSSQLFFHASDPCLIYLFSEKQHEIPSEVINTLNDLSPKVIKVDDITTPSQFLKSLENTNTAKAINSLYNFGLTKTAESLKTLLELSIDQQKRSLKSRKVMNNEKVIEIKAGSENSEKELFNSLKKEIVSYSKSVLKGTEEQLDKNLHSRDSKVQHLAESYGNNLIKFDEVKSSKEVLLKIPNDYKSSFISDLKTSLLQAGQDNLISINDALKDMTQKVEKKFSENKIETFYLSPRYLSDLRLKELITEHVHLDKDFQGSLPKKGAYEYFMAARKFQMILFMVASSFGLSFMRNLKLYMIPLTVILLGFGAISIFRSVQKERAEKIKEEKKKVLDLFKSEAKKSSSDFSRSWYKHLKDGIETYENNLLQVIEDHLKEIANNSRKKLDLEKEKVKNQSQNLDDTARKIQNMDRTVDNIKKVLDKLQADYKREISLI